MLVENDLGLLHEDGIGVHEDGLFELAEEDGKRLDGPARLLVVENVVAKHGSDVQYLDIAAELHETLAVLRRQIGIPKVYDLYG